MQLILSHCRSVVDVVREFREFVASKRIKREPIWLTVRGVSRASFKPRDAHAFADIRLAMRGNGDFGRASERIDALERELQRRHGCWLPLPEEVVQNTDRSVFLSWAGISVRAYPHGLGYLIGGTSGQVGKGYRRELLDALAFRAKIA